MKKIITLIVLILFTLIVVGQELKTNVLPTQSKVENYIIGIGNENDEVYFDCLDYLEHSNEVKVYAICETHHIIGFMATHKSYDIVTDILLSEFPTILLFKKDNSIFNLDCKNEISKQ